MKKMKNYLILCSLMLTGSMLLAQSQNVGIGTTTPAASAALEIEATDKGLLIPRMDSTARKAISSPAEGLMVFDSTYNVFYYYANSAWQEVGATGSTSVFDTLNGVVLPGNAVDISNDDFVFGSDQLNDDGDLDHDARFFFDKSKAVFRAGLCTSTEWNKASLGEVSFASGYNTTASGDYSTAMGENNIASGQSSTAMGIGTVASGGYSTAMGNSTTASGTISVALGLYSTASGENSTAMGYSTIASGIRSTAMGRSSIASGNNSTSIGNLNNASGHYATAMGSNTTAPSGYEITMGSYNTSYTPISGDNYWNTADRLFTIGNGTSNSNRSDALVMLKSGEIGIGTSTPDTTLHVVGQIKYDDGNQANGYVLTSDADGNASWQANTVLTDADNDTRIQVEESTDADIISFYVAGRRVGGVDSVANWDFIGGEDYGDNLLIGAGGIGTGGANNVFIGKAVAAANTSGLSNTAVGTSAMTQNESGARNVALGAHSLQSQVEGSENVALGFAAGLSNSVGSGNVFIGYLAGYNETGSNKLYIDNSNANENNALIYGEFDNDLLAINGTLRLNDGTQSDGYLLTSDADGNASWQEASASSSDTLAIISDADNDTKIQVEESADEDIIRFDVAGTEAVTIDNSGYVGIGTSSPDARLNILDSTRADLTLQILDNDVEQGIAFQNSGGAYSWNIYRTPNGNNTSDLRFAGAAAGSAANNIKNLNEYVTFQAGGSVGIGTSSPRDVLEIYSDTAGSGITIASSRPVFTLEDTDANTWLIEMNARKLQFTEDGVGTAMTIEDATGFVGIGVTNPGYALQVGSSGDGTQARANAWNTFSDRRWKKDFEIIPDALKKLNQVNGYFYNWKEGIDTTQQVGVIAQEIEEILPQAVSTDENGYKSVDYSKLTAWLIQVNKEQQAQIKKLKTDKKQTAGRLNALEAEKEATNERLARLEALLNKKLIAQQNQ
jgi:hypothetical protein